MFRFHRRTILSVRLLPFLAATLAGLLLWGSLGPPALTASTRVALLLPDLLLFQPLRPSLLVTFPPSTRPLRWTAVTGTEHGVLYRPAIRRPAPGVVVSLGVYPAALESPEVQRLGDALARSGLVALFPASPRLQAGQVLPEEVSVLRAAVEALRQQPEVDPQRVGLLGFSIGGGLVLLAAADEQSAGKVTVVASVGGYADAVDLLRQVGSRTRLAPGRPPWQPAELAVLAYRRQLIDTLLLASDRDLLEATFFAPDPPPLDPLRLSLEGQQVYTLLTTTDPATVDALLSALPPAAQTRLHALSPLRHLTALRAPAFLLHDQADPFIPVEESRRLAAALGPQAWYEEYRLFDHVIPTGNPSPVQLGRELARLAVQLHGWYRQLSQ